MALSLSRCPYRDDRYLTTVVAVDGSSGLLYPTHHKRFIFQMFTFVDHDTLLPLKERVGDDHDVSTMVISFAAELAFPVCSRPI